MHQYNRRFIRKNSPYIIFISFIAALTFIAGLWIGQYRAELLYSNKSSTYIPGKKPIDDLINVERPIRIFFNDVHQQKEDVVKPNGKVASRVYYFQQVNTSDNGEIIKLVKNTLPSIYNASKVKEDRQYMEFRKLDSPAIGDVHCAGTAVDNSCAFYIQSIDEGKNICNNLENFCKGFVLTTESKEDGTTEFLAYMKTDVGNVAANVLTDFFVKTKFIKEVKWRPP